MDDDTYVHIKIRGKLSQTTGNHILKFEFLWSSGLLREHELHIINTDQLYVIGIDSIVERFKQQVDRSRTIEIQEIERVLFELIHNQV